MFNQYQVFKILKDDFFNDKIQNKKLVFTNFDFYRAGPKNYRQVKSELDKNIYFQQSMKDKG